MCVCVCVCVCVCEPACACACVNVKHMHKKKQKNNSPLTPSNRRQVRIEKCALLQNETNQPLTQFFLDFLDI